MENHGGPTTERAQDVCPTCQPVQEYDGQERAHRNKFRPLSKQIAKQAGGAGSATRIGARVKPAKVGRHRRLKIKTGAQIGSVRIYYGDRHALIAAGVMPPPTPGESPPAKAATAGQAVIHSSVYIDYDHNQKGGVQITSFVLLCNRVNLCDCKSRQNIGSVENSGFGRKLARS